MNLRGWSETDGEYRQRLTEEAWAALERRETAARLAIRPARPYSPPTHKLVLDRVEGNNTYWKNILLEKP